jgi:ubiquitin carboxyl-terminal hydrolase L5
LHPPTALRTRLLFLTSHRFLFPARLQEDAFHFIAYVPFEGKVYELDGLKPGPILLGEGEDWLAVARPAIQARIER